jgi:Fe-S cluster biosynthesis and repair protein YggX
MTAVTCRRCNLEKESLEKPPFRGTLGQKIFESVCKDCWAEWQAMQTKIINEYRLSLGDPRGQEVLDQQLRLFLNLPAQP